MPLLHFLLSALEDAVMAFDISSNQYLFISPAVEGITGYSEADMKQQPGLWEKIIDPLDLNEVVRSTQQLTQSGEVKLTHRIISADGTLKWVQVKMVRFILPDTQHEVLMHIIRDVTDILFHRRESQKKITFLESVINAGPALLFRINPDQEYTFVNDTYSRDFGQKKSDLIGKKISDFWHPDDAGKVKEIYQEAKNKPGQVIHITHRRWDKDRKIHWLECDIVGVKDEFGEVKEIQGVGLDVTKQHLIQMEIKRTKETLEALINNTEDNIWSVDCDRRILFANKAYKEFVFRIFQIDIQPGMQLHERVSGNEQSLYIEKYKKLYDKAFEGNSFRAYNEFTDPTTQAKIIQEVGFNPIYNEIGQVTGTACVARDVTRQLAAQDEIRQQNARLREIASLSSHELRAPVATIMGLINLLEEEDVSDPDKKHVVADLKTKSMQLDDVIHQIVNTTFIPNNPL
ncbi:PAS domain S-box protein [Xanthocytophaga agilis]|uniref:histidine kinase n=1 Tax=Xanthocytophaga agilis TaxID=3048010 RepID=A0AAE3RAD8_9BACT|nr:PAS domain S-box protein [Xanthocytophaga agilis]MDJ1506891.1 PAS domain S-box protein [Xanthocytophaga agilis]